MDEWPLTLLIGEAISPPVTGGYTPPRFDDLRDAVASDLRDPLHKAFTDTQIGDLVNEGIAELNRLRPLERIESLPLVEGSKAYATTLQGVFLVEGKRQGEPAYWPIPETDYAAGVGSQGGWTLFGGFLVLPGLMTPLDPDVDDIRVWGYRDRNELVADSDVPQFIDLTDEQAVRSYARYTALEMLLHDRALFQQWQTQTNNSDISATQLLQAASTLQGQWDTLRKRVARLRRVA